MPYNPNATDWDNECLVIEQQLEGALGTDFIDIIVEPGPSTGFLAEVRRSGKYALMKCNWGADYADPQTWTDPMDFGNSYNFMYTNENKVLSDIPATNKTAETQALVEEYYGMTAIAKATIADEAARYEAFANAEAFLLEHAFIVPFHLDSSGYIASYMDPFDAPYAPYGMSVYKTKGRRLLDTPMSSSQFEAAKAQWETERAAALAAAR
jgi:oligopeptide transport system substrate-binding protein